MTEYHISIPSFLLHRAHAANLALWTRRLPLLHGPSAAEVAASILENIASELEALADTAFQTHSNGTDITTSTTKRRYQQRRVAVIALDSTSGEAIPSLESALNDTRSPIQRLQFKLTDPHPNVYLDRWIYAAAGSDYLQFLPQPVDTADAADPPSGVVSRTSAVYDRSTTDVGHSALKLYLWLGSFHSLYTARKQARKARPDTMSTSLLHAAPDESSPSQTAIHHAIHHSDAFVILDLEDRRLMSVLGIAFLRFWYLWLTIVLWSPWHRDILALLFSVPIPFVPALGAWEGIKAALRARTFDEMMALIDRGLGFAQDEAVKKSWFETEFRDERRFAERAGWLFEGRRVRYRWPFGYVNAFVARRRDVKSRRHT